VCCVFSPQTAPQQEKQDKSGFLISAAIYSIAYIRALKCNFSVFQQVKTLVGYQRSYINESLEFSHE
jgi:hypothetical protein